ncbi:unnamed protein product, partial [Prorocentrum cordatum]
SFGSRRPRRLWRERAPARPPGARLGRHGPPARPPVRAGAGGRRAGGLPGEQPRSGAVRGPPRSRRRSPRGTAHGRLVGRPRRRARRRAARGAPAGRRARRGAAEHCGARGVEGVCPTRDGGRRLLHAERHRHESQGGRDQGVSRRRALCCSPSTCSRGADMRRQHALHKCSYNAAGLANRGAVFMYIAGRVRPLWAPYLAGAAPVAACIRATASSARLCAQEARARGVADTGMSAAREESGGLGRPCVFSR